MGIKIKEGLKKFGNKALDWVSQRDTQAILFLNSFGTYDPPKMVLFESMGVENSQGITITSNITNNYTEANNSINDHWAIQPITYTLSGLIGEVIYHADTQYVIPGIKQITNYVRGLGVISPTLDSYTRDIENIAQAIDESIERYRQVARNALESWGKIQPRMDEQTVRIQENIVFVYNAIRNIIENRQLVSVETRWGTIDNLAITEFSIRNDDNRYQSSIDIKMQQWRDVLTITRPATEAEKSMFAQNQVSETVDHGVASTNSFDKSSTLYKIMIEGGGNLLDAISQYRF